MTDERKGQPSASGIERIALCPGSWNLESKLPPAPQSEDAATGDRIHAALAGVEGIELTSDDQELLDRIRALENELIEKHLGEFKRLWREERLWLNDGSFSGRFDGLAVRDGEGVLWDVKTGRNEVATAEGNLQLRALAILAARNYGLLRVVVAIIQPWASPQVSVCEYGISDLIKAEAELEGILWSSGLDNAPLIPGEKQCLYCRAHSVCPAVHQKLEVAKREFNQLPAVITAEHLEIVNFVSKRCDEIKAVAKAQLQAAPDSIPGWTLKPGATRTEIKDVNGSYASLVASGAMDAETFLKSGCVKLNLGNTVDAVGHRNGMSKKDARKMVDSCAAPFAEEKQNEASLMKVKEAA